MRMEGGVVDADVGRIVELSFRILGSGWERRALRFAFENQQLVGDVYVDPEYSRSSIS